MIFVRKRVLAARSKVGLYIPEKGRSLLISFNVKLAPSETLLPSLVARAMLNGSISPESNSLCGFITVSYSLRIRFYGQP